MHNEAHTFKRDGEDKAVLIYKMLLHCPLVPHLVNSAVVGFCEVAEMCEEMINLL